MTGSITLHPTLGVNPHLTYCRRCGGDCEDLILLGARDGIYRCDDCGLNLIGGGPCPDHPGRHTTFVRKVEEHEKLPAGPCRACRDEIELHEKIVAEGGVYFRCSECSSEGVIKPDSELARAVREHARVAPPKPIGITFDVCQQHTPRS